MKILGYLSVTITLLTYSALMHGWALSKLWSWFISRTFDVPELSIPAAIGFLMVVNYLTTKIDLQKKKEKEEYLVTLLNGFMISTIKPLFALILGAIVKIWL